MLGGALLGAAANRQVCPTISQMTFGNHSKIKKWRILVLNPNPTRASIGERLC